MKQFLFWTITCLLGFYACGPSNTAEHIQVKEDEGHEISFYTKDSVQIIADLYQHSKTAATILLFHQGGSNARAEYHSIIPQLTEAGYNVLAIDQRVGGQTYGSYNRTIATMSTNEFEYCDAYLDLEAALEYIKNQGFTGKKVVWGSSYSASLGIKLAHQYQEDVSAVLAFSPASGGPMQACKPDEYFSTLKVPLLLLRPKKEMEIESVAKQFELAVQHNHDTYVAEDGTHGSSMLVGERVNADVTANWEIIKSFLKKAVK